MTVESTAEPLVGSDTELVDRLASRIAAGGPLGRMLTDALELLCRAINWPVGHLFLLSGAEPQQALPTSIWHLDSQRFEPFRVETDAMRIRVGLGLLGEVVASGRPRWLGDVAQTPSFSRRAAAAGVGIRSGLVVPVRTETEIAGALELYAERQLSEDILLLATVTQVGRLLGEALGHTTACAAETCAAAEAADLLSPGVKPLRDAFIKTNASFLLLDAGPELERLVGSPLTELLGKSLWSVLPGRLTSHLREHLETAFNGPARSEIELYYPPRRSWLRVRTEARNEQLTIWLDETLESQRTPEAARESEAHFFYLAQLIPPHVWTAAPDGTLDYVNQRVLDDVGGDFETLLQQGWAAVVHPDDIRGMLERWQLAVRFGRSYEDELRLRDRLGVYRWHLVRALPWRDSEGRVIKWFGTNTEIERLKRAEAERDRALAETQQQLRRLAQVTTALQRSNQELDQFAYVASHDLKAPLRGIATVTEWLEEDLGSKIDGDSRRNLARLRTRVERMQALIDGMLAYSRAGKFEDVAPEPVDIKKLLEEVIDLLVAPAKITFVIDDELPTLTTDRLPLQQVLHNLIENALKHASGVEAPRITIRCREQQQPGGDQVAPTGVYRFEITDNGPGIPSRYQEKIWRIFLTLQRPDDDASAGIGLALVKKLVEQRGGRIWLQSEEGRGASFLFDWPSAKSDGVR